MAAAPRDDNLGSNEHRELPANVDGAQEIEQTLPARVRRLAPRSRAGDRACRRLGVRHAVLERRMGGGRPRQHPVDHIAIPFCNFGEAVDPPSADVTAHVLEALASLGFTAGVLSTSSTSSRKATAAGASTTFRALAQCCRPRACWVRTWRHRALAVPWSGFLGDRTRTAVGLIVVRRTRSGRRAGKTARPVGH